MSDAKIQVEVGQFRFSREGEQQWLAQQMDKILKSAEALTNLASVLASNGTAQVEGGGAGNKTIDEALPQFLKRTQVGKRQVDRFLATGEWLHLKGKKSVRTADVSKALKDAHQSKLGNPADCFAQNASKGFCVKDGKEFYVTDEGRKHLGLS